MIVELTLPRLGETMEMGRVTAWLKQPGDKFRRGETLVEVESDKTVVEMPALADGVLVEIVAQAGSDADVGAVLCRYEDGVERHTPDPPPRPPDEPVAQPRPQAAAWSGTSSPSGVRATPPARALAHEHGVALSDVTGTGRRGRVEVDDVRAALPSSSVAPVGIMQWLDIPGGRIAYRSWTTAVTSRPRILLLHGLAADMHSWAVLAARLERAGRHVMALDLPSHGETTLEAPQIEALVDAVEVFLDRLGGAPVELVGHSLGGAVAAMVGRRASAGIARLTLLAPAGLDHGIDADFVRGIAQARTRGSLRHLLRRLSTRPAALTGGQLDALAAELSRGRLVGLADAMVADGGQQIDITDDLRALTLPVRVVWGVQDRILPWTQVSQAGSRAEIHLIQDAGHVPHWDQPEEVAALFD